MTRCRRWLPWQRMLVVTRPCSARHCRTPTWCTCPAASTGEFSCRGPQPQLAFACTEVVMLLRCTPAKLSPTSHILYRERAWAALSDSPSFRRLRVQQEDAADAAVAGALRLSLSLRCDGMVHGFRLPDWRDTPKCHCRRGQRLQAAQAALQGIGRQCILGHRIGGPCSASIWCARTASGGCCVAQHTSGVHRPAGCRRREQWRPQWRCQRQLCAAAVRTQLAAGSALRHAAWLCRAAPPAADAGGCLCPGMAAHSRPARDHPAAGAGTYQLRQLNVIHNVTMQMVSQQHRTCAATATPSLAESS